MTTEIEQVVVLDQPMTSIDLRSDTVSWPTLEMRVAMANAAVGDDVWGDDPTVLKLEETAAKLLDKEAALFVTSGTQGNLISILVHCRAGDELIVGDKGHIILYEAGGVSALAGVIPRTVPVQSDGTLLLEDVKAAVRGDDIHNPRTRMIAIENTQNKMGGVPLSLEYLHELYEFSKAQGLKLHMDGARVFNAAAALNVPVSEIVQYCDSITFCLSKGLCAPAGSILCGTKKFIAEAKRKRKMLGGGLRQTGILAAAGLIAIEKMPALLHRDHEAAKIIADGISKLPGVKVTMSNTNFVFFDLTSESPYNYSEVEEKLRQYRPPILCKAYTETTFRFVTHHWITPERAHIVVEAMTEIFSK